MKFSRFTLIGVLCLAAYMLFGCLIIKQNEFLFYFIYIICMIVWIALTVLFLSFTMSDTRSRSWLLLVPFTVTMIFMRSVFEWNLIIPFLIVGILAVCIDSSREIVRKEEKPAKKVLLHFLVGFISIAVYICVFAFMGVTV